MEIGMVRVTLNNLSLLLADPLRSGESNLRTTQAAELLDMLAQILGRGEDGYADLVAFAQELKTIADASRPPTIADWKSLRTLQKEESSGGSQEENTTPPIPVSSIEQETDPTIEDAGVAGV